MSTIREFEKWLSKSPPGARFVYHVGDLANDIEKNARLAAKAARLRAEFQAGKVELVQRRWITGFGKTDYIAVKRANRPSAGEVERRRKLWVGTD